MTANERPTADRAVTELGNFDLMVAVEKAIADMVVAGMNTRTADFMAAKVRLTTLNDELMRRLDAATPTSSPAPSVVTTEQLAELLHAEWCQHMGADVSWNGPEMRDAYWQIWRDMAQKAIDAIPVAQQEAT